MTPGDFCLADSGRTYVVYLPRGGTVAVKLEPGNYRTSWFNPRSGETIELPAASGPNWTSAAAPDGGDWVLLLRQD